MNSSKMFKEINFVKRKNIINFYLDLMNQGIKLNKQQKHLLKELSKSINYRNEN